MNNAFAERPLRPLEYVTILEQDTRLELALSVWKTDVLTTDTNPAYRGSKASQPYKRRVLFGLTY